MSTNAEQPSDADALSTNRRRSKSKPAGGMLRQALPALVIASLGIVTAFALLGWQFIQEQAQATDQAVNQSQLTSYSNYFDQRLLLARKAVEQAATSAIARGALATDDAAKHRRAADNLLDTVAYGKRLDIIPKGRAEVDLSADVPITFAGLDVIKRAESQEFVGPEFSINPPGLVYTAAPITRDGTVAGVLFVVFSKDFWLEPLTSTSDANLGQINLQQQFEGLAPATVMQWGQGEDTATELQAKLGIRHLSLSYLPGIAARSTTENWLKLAMPFSVALLVTLGGIVLAFLRMGKRLGHDHNQLATNVVRLSKGQPINNTGYALMTSQQLADDLSQQLHRPTANNLAEPTTTDPATNQTTNQSANVDDLLGVGQDNEDDYLEVNEPATKANEIDDDNFGIAVEEQDNPSAADMGVQLDPDIFRAYDIRGVTTTNLTEQVVYWIGRAFAAEAKEHNMARVAIGRDGRHSSAGLAASLAKGLTEGGLDVLDIGQVPTPLLYYATHSLKTGTGIMITGSHNPPEYNGLKMVMAGETLAEERISRLQQRIDNNELSEGNGEVEAVSVEEPYLDQILDDVALAQPKKVVVDCGNGVASELAPKLLEEMGCEVVPLYCEVDGDFPNHHPDPAEPANLEDLITVVDAEKADIGLAFDGDGDRLGVVTPRGNIVWPDTLMMLFSQDIISRNPGADIIYDVKCSRHLNPLISEAGGRPIMWKTGHSHIKAKMKETGALLGGEFSGHICFGERWYGFDDALYSAARLMEIVSSDERNADELFAQYPATFSTPEIKIQTTDSEKFAIMDKLVREGNFGAGAVTSIDGVRVDYDDGWGLIRPSNTSPVLSLRFEADTEDALESLQARFAEQLERVDPKLTFR